MRMPAPLNSWFRKKHFQGASSRAQQVTFHLENFLALHQPRDESVLQFDGALQSCLLIFQLSNLIWRVDHSLMNIGSRLES